MSVNSKMTAVADKIRALLGMTDKLGLDAMASKLGTAVDVCDDQATLIAQIKEALEGKAVGGGESGGESGVTIKTTTTQLSTGGRTISFTGLTGQPKSFSIVPTGNINLGSIRYVTGVMYDGSNTHGTYGYRSSSSATSYYSNSYFTWSYDNGTLTVNTASSNNGGNFSSNVSYMLVYVY